MPKKKDPKDIYVNDLNTTLKDAIKKMSKKSIGYSRHYGDEMNKFLTTPAVKGLLKTKAEAMSISQIKDQIRNKLNKTYPNFVMGKMPIKCIDGKIRHYKPDPWCFMVSRTASRDFREMGLHQEMVKAGLDLVIISVGGSNDPCRNWEGKVCSITGETKGYPRIDEIRATGEIWHPNCVHSTSPFMLYTDETGEVGLLGRDLDDYGQVKGTYGLQLKGMSEAFRKETVERIEEPQPTLDIDRAQDARRFQAYLSPEDIDNIPDSKILGQYLDEGESFLIYKRGTPEHAKLKNVHDAISNFTGNGYSGMHKVDIWKQTGDISYVSQMASFPRAEFEANAKRMRAFLAKAPKYTAGPIQRSVPKLTDQDIEYFNKLKPGDKYHFKSYTSFSSSQAKFHGGRTKLQFHIQEPINSGVDVDKVSGFPGEKEVIVIKQDFFVSKVERITRPVHEGGGYKYDVWLTEKEIPKGGNPI